MSKLGLVIVLGVVAGLVLYQYPVADYFYPKSQAGVRAMTNDADNMVEAHADGVTGQLKQASYKRDDGTVDLNAYSDSRLPKAQEVAQASLRRLEVIAGAEGRLLSHPARTIRGNDWHWVRTNIPILGCMKITAAGEIWRNGASDPPAGPDGADYSRNPIHANKSTIIPGLRWGTFIGKVCYKDDAQGNRCGVEMPLGSLAYRSPNQIIAGGQVGAGVLWVWTNQFGTNTDRSDYNIAGGSYSFDAEPVQQALCDAITTVR